MELRIDDKTTIRELQQQFSAEFPYLKIEFFSLPYSSSRHLSKAYMYPSAKTLGYCRKVHKEGILKITPDDTVEKLEKILWEEFGLATEIFRKSGKLWIETSLSSSWTLKFQNEEGKTFSEGEFKPFVQDEDITDRDKWQ